MESDSEYFDYYSQMIAIRSLLSRQDQAGRQLEDEMKEVDTLAAQSSGDANDHWVDEWIDLANSWSYQAAAHSMAAVGMIAPLIESAFERTLRRKGKKYSGKGIVEKIMKCIDELGMKEYMPDDLGMTLKALFEYRNKMFHCGFEWPLEERRRFEETLNESGWPRDWFEKATIGDKPWMFHMSSKFTDHCANRATQVMEGIQKFELGISPNEPLV